MTQSSALCSYRICASLSQRSKHRKPIAIVCLLIHKTRSMRSLQFELQNTNIYHDESLARNGAKPWAPAHHGCHHIGTCTLGCSHCGACACVLRACVGCLFVVLHKPLSSSKLMSAYALSAIDETRQAKIRFSIRAQMHKQTQNTHAARMLFVRIQNHDDVDV